MELAKNVKTHGNNGRNGWTRKQQQTTTLSEPTSVGIDAIDTDMNARAGDAELIPWLLVLDCAPQLSFVRDTEAECCHVGGLLPCMIRIACSLSSRLVAALSGAAATAGAAGDSSTPVGVSSLSLLWSSASGSITCASGSLSVASASASGA